MTATMMKGDEILLPDGNYQERLYDKALVMDDTYQERYYELMYENSRAGIILLFVHSHMNEDGEVIASYESILDFLQKNNIKYSYATAIRAVKIIKQKYSDLVQIDRFKGTNRFIVDKNRCFVSRKEV